MVAESRVFVLLSNGALAGALDAVTGCVVVPTTLCAICPHHPHIGVVGRKHICTGVPCHVVCQLVGVHSTVNNVSQETLLI